jgi:pyruvate-ferredoxin/flavodoxin oxidoreductase
MPPRAFAAQSSIAFGHHLQAAVAAALDNDGPALLRVHAPSPSRHGFAADATLARAEAAVEARVWPLWTAPPAEAPGEARVVDLAGNPDAAALGVVEWALGEGRFAKHFTAHREKDGEAVEVERYLALPRTDRQGKVAVVETADRGRLRVSAPLVAAAESRLATWAALLERGVRPDMDAEAVPAAELAERDRAHQAELTVLRADYESRLAAAHQQTRTELAQQVRRRLMALAMSQRPDTGPRSGEVPS